MTADLKSPASRLWVPGVVFVTDEGEVRRGSGAGRLVDAAGYPTRAAGAVAKLADLRHTLWLVERARLDDELVERYAIVLPERLLDPDEQPHARRWFSELPLLCVSGVKWERIVGEDRVRLHRVSVSDEGGRVVLAIESAGGRVPRTRVAVAVDALVEVAQGAPEGRSVSRLVAEETVVDRFLRTVSGGALDEGAVVAAHQAATLLEPGYGYRGATDGSPATIEQVQYGARALEAAFSQIFPRADEQRVLAESLLMVLDTPRAEGESMPSAPDGAALERETLRALELSAEELEGEAMVDGERASPLVLGADPRWFVPKPEPWRPEIPPSLARELSRVLEERAPPPQWLVLLAVALLIGLALLSLFLRR